MPGEQLATDLSRIDGFAAEFRGATGPDDQAAAFYSLDGLARELAGSADIARADADEALGMATAAEGERDEALSMAGEAAPHDESEALAALRRQVAELTGQLATAQADTKAERRLRTRADEALAAEQKRHGGEVRGLRRRLATVQGALAVTKAHVCRPEDVPHMAPAGVLRTLRVWLQNSAPSQQSVHLEVEQHRDGEHVTLRLAALPNAPGHDEELVVIDEPPTERSSVKMITAVAPEETDKS